MKGKFVAAAAALAAVPAVSSAESSISLSGQVNVAALLGDAVDSLTVVDNNTTGSRFRIRAKKDFGGFSAGLRYELQAQFAQSNDPTEIGTNSGAADGTVREVRYADVYISGGFGKIAIGRGDGAANGTSESYGLLNFLGGAESHLLFNGAGADFSDIDGLSRQNRIRYDSPNFGGLTFAASADNEEEIEVAAGYNKKGGFGAIRGRIGFTTGEGDQETFDLSVAYKAPFGLGLAYSTGSFDNTAGITTSENDWFMVSYDFGKKWTLSAGFGFEDEFVGDTGETVDADLLIISLLWKPVKGANVYLNFGSWDNELATGEIEEENDEASVFALGGRFLF